MKCPQCHADLSCVPGCKLATLSPLRGDIFTAELRANGQAFASDAPCQFVRQAEALKLEFHSKAEELLKGKSQVADLDRHRLNQLQHYANFEKSMYPEATTKLHILDWAVSQIEAYHELLKGPF